MIQSNFHSIKSQILKLITGCVLAIWACAAYAEPISVLIGPAEENPEPILIDWTADEDADETGVLIQNLSDQKGQVTIELLTGMPEGVIPPEGLKTPEGFKLLDTTLYVKSELMAGARRIRARMDYGRFGRAGLRELGIRANSLRLMRADFESKRWIRAVRSIVETERADIRYFGGREFGRGADFILGHHGFDDKNEFVWAVMDSSGEQYFAIGGLTAVPIPAAWLLFVTGSGLLFIAGRRRTKVG